MKVRTDIMVKMKEMNKTLAALGVSAMMLLGTATTAFAYTGETPPEELKQQEQVLEENKVNTEGAFTTPGNGQVQDDIKNDGNKEFLTITTKNNQTFYIVIDHSSNTDNVYMLSKVDENDLQQFLEDPNPSKNEKPEIVLDENIKPDIQNPVTEPAKPEKEPVSSMNPTLLGILGVSIVGLAGYAYMRFFKSKKDEDDDMDEGMEIAGETEETKEEDE